MTPEAVRFLDKAETCLRHARAILAIGLGDEAGRCAYLAGFHAAQAYIFEATGKIAKTHGGVQSSFVRLVRDDPRFPLDLRPFLTQAYHLKAVADYETGPEATVPLPRAVAAIETADRFLIGVKAMLR